MLLKVQCACISITWRLLNADTDSTGLEGGLSFCMSIRLPGCSMLLVHGPHFEEQGSRIHPLVSKCHIQNAIYKEISSPILMHMLSPFHSRFIISLLALTQTPKEINTIVHGTECLFNLQFTHISISMPQTICCFNYLLLSYLLLFLRAYLI